MHRKESNFCSTLFFLHNVVFFWQGSIIKLNSLFAPHPPISDLKENSRALSLANNGHSSSKKKWAAFERVVEESAKCSNFPWNKYLNDSRLAHPLRCQCRICTPGLYEILARVVKGGLKSLTEDKKRERYNEMKDFHVQDTSETETN